jgi:hypothetical protein
LAVWRWYDLLADPAESRDLAKEQPERVAAMQEQLAGEIARVK